MKVSADYIELEREPFDSFQLCISALMCTAVTRFCRWDKEFEVRGAGRHALSQEEICSDAEGEMGQTGRCSN